MAATIQAASLIQSVLRLEDAEEDAQVVLICEPVVQAVSDDDAVVPVALNMLRRIPSPVSSSSREARMSSSSDEESTGSEDVQSS